MKYEEINRRYTEKVNSYLLKGYTINTASMSGSQGEIAKIDLTNGKEVIRIILEKRSNIGKPSSIDIFVGRSFEAKPNSSDSWKTIWNNRLQKISCEKYFELYTRLDRETEYGTEEEATAIWEKKLNRYRNHDNGVIKLTNISDNEEAKRIAIKYLKRSLGQKRITSSVKIQKNGRYFRITYREKSYTLH